MNTDTSEKKSPMQFRCFLSVFIRVIRVIRGLPLLPLCVSVPFWFNSSLAAQEPPLANRPAQFSNIVGSYTIAVRAAPLDVPVEEPITLHVTIAGKGPAKYAPDRKHLKLLPESWARDFYVEPMPDDDRLSPDAGTWDFAYRLRPKHTKVTAIDGIKLVYYEPAGKGGGKFQTRYADPIEIAVKPRRAAPDIPEHLAVRTAPESFYELPSADVVMTEWERPWSLPVWVLIALGIGPPLLTVLAVYSVGRSKLGRHRKRELSAAAKHAVGLLGSADGGPVWTVLCRYLRDRLSYPAAEATPDEARRFLRRHGASRAIADQVAAVLGACDTARFGGPAAAAGPERANVARLIGLLEDDLCDT